MSTAPHRLGDLSALRRDVAAVPDPELPMCTLSDLGILRSIERGPNGVVEVTITPTFLGCPAMEMIRREIQATIERHGEQGVVHSVLAPPWSTDAITDVGRNKLVAAGIAVPARGARSTPPVRSIPIEWRPACPQCGSRATGRISSFGATACRALHVCQSCGEPFETMKAL